MAQNTINPAKLVVTDAPRGYRSLIIVVPESALPELPSAIDSMLRGEDRYTIELTLHET